MTEARDGSSSRSQGRSAGPPPMRHRGMREHNLAVVLGEVARSGSTSRASIADATGLTRSTVSTLVGELVKARLLVSEGPNREGERGRPSIGVALDGGHVAGIGCDIGVDRMGVAVLDLRRRTRVRLERITSNRRPPEAVFADLAVLIAEAERLAQDQELTVVGAAVGVPGLLDQRSGHVIAAPNLGWREVELAGHLDGLLPAAVLPARVDNEANLAALGELRLGAGVVHPSFMLVTGEVGIGAGLVIGSSLYSGADGYAGEIGHVVVDPAGRSCTCGGRGCLETVAGLHALLRAAGLDEDAGLDVLRKALEGDVPAAWAAVDAAAQALSLAFAAAVNLVSPGVIVLGGVLAALDDVLVPRLVEGVAAQVGALRGAPPLVVSSSLGTDAAVLGGAVAVLDAVVAGPDRVMATAS